MKRLLITFALLTMIAVPARATEISAPPAPEAAQKYMPKETTSFGEDLWYIVKQVGADIFPSVADAVKSCLGVVVSSILCSILQSYTLTDRKLTDLAGSVSAGILMLKPVNTFVGLGVETVSQITEYGKMLLPVMTTALAAEGGATTAASLYTTTAFFDNVLSTMISKLLIPLMYVFLCLAVAQGTIGEGIVGSLKQFLKWLMTWGLKILLYIFISYIGVTGIVNGTTDAIALKAAKLTISGAVPVVGGIMAEASETVLVSAQIVKNSVGTYGLVAVIALTIGPFLQIAIQYLLMKLTAGLCTAFPCGRMSEVMKDFAAGMGLMLAMTGAVCLLFLISLVCFMRGVG